MERYPHAEQDTSYWLQGSALYRLFLDPLRECTPQLHASNAM